MDYWLGYHYEQLLILFRIFEKLYGMRQRTVCPKAQKRKHLFTDCKVQWARVVSWGLTLLLWQGTYAEHSVNLSDHSKLSTTDASGKEA